MPVDRLGQVVVHPGGEATFAIARHRMRRHRDHAQVPAGCRFPLSDCGRRLEAAHLRHLHVHQHHVEIVAFDRRQRLAAIPRHGDVVPAPRQQSDRHLLIDDVVFGKQDLDATDRRLWHRDRSGRDSRPPLRLEHVQDRVEKIRPLDWLGQVGRDPEVTAPGGIAVLARRGQHHDRGARELGPLSNLFRDAEAVQIRHVRIEHDEQKRFARLGGGSQRLERRLSSVDGGRLHVPSRELLAKNPPVDLVVVHDQHRKASEKRIVRARPALRLPCRRWP